VNQGPRTDGPNENVCDLGGGASKVASQMVPRWEQVEDRRLEFCLRAGSYHACEKYEYYGG